MYTKKFKALESISNSIGEHNDCTVKAVAMFCNVRYMTAHKTLANLGRVKGRGTNMLYVKAAIESLSGRQLVPSWDEIKGHRTPATYVKLTKGKQALVVVRGHIIYMKDGVIHDHDGCNNRRIQEVLT